MFSGWSQRQTAGMQGGLARMTLSPTARLRLYTAAGGVLAVVFGAQLAQGEWLWPLVVAGSLIALAAQRMLALPLGTALLGLLSVGYLVGNRGFAQLSLSGSLPLFPAEVVLALVGGMWLWSCAWRRELPWQREALAWLVLGWMGLSALRLPLDIRAYGMDAGRDFATVYYAAFFFLVVAAGRSEPGRRFLHRCLLLGCALLVLSYSAFTWLPELTGAVTVRGLPVVFFKGDLAGTFLALGAVLYFAVFEERKVWWALGGSLVMAGLVLYTNNRASLLGLAVAAGLLALGGRWRMLAWLTGLGGLAVAVILLVSQVRNQSWTETPLYGVYERVVSVVDPLGERQYTGDQTFNKGDNNRFRSMWWRITLRDTVRENPWTGRGWGCDLAEPFARVYFPDGTEDFTARSPHNLLITLFARTGLLGLLPFLAIVTGMLVRTWQAVRQQSSRTASLWAGVWVVLVSACFGVVLEGPMGAVVFWITLGLALAGWMAEREEKKAEEPAAVPLPRAAIDDSLPDHP